MKNKLQNYLVLILIIFLFDSFFAVNAFAAIEPKEVIGDEPVISAFESFGFEKYKSEVREVMKDNYYDARIEYRLPEGVSELGGSIWVRVDYIARDDFEQMTQVKDITKTINWAKEQKNDYYNYSVTGNYALKSRENALNIVGEIYYLNKPIVADIDFNVPKANYNDFLTELISYLDSLFDKASGSLSTETESEQSGDETEIRTENSDDGNQYTVEGRLFFDQEGLVQNQAENMMIYLNVFSDKGKKLELIEVDTNDKGEFSADFPYPADQGYTVVVNVPLVYFDNEDQAIFYVTDDETAMDEVVFIYCGEYKINSPTDLKIVSNLYDSEVFEGTTGADTSPNAYVYFYQSMKEAVDYYKDVFNFTFDSRLPIKLILNETDTETASATGYYDPETSQIHIMKDYSKITSSAMPFTIYHELSHYVMKMMYYPDYPGDSGIDTDTHHGGYANSYTGYSYSEGFAIFMENVIGLHYYNEFSNIMGNPELNHKTWENYGFSETIAVASLLYDLIDSGENDDDNVAIDDLFMVLSKKQRHCADLYEALQVAYPDISEDINQIFVNHGFFAVTDKLEEGAGIHNAGEAFVDLNENFTYDEGEPFVDYNAKDENGIYYQEYRENYDIGHAAYADDPNRYRTFLLPGHFVKIDTPYNKYQISYKFSDRTYLNYTVESDVIDGYMYVQNPPSNYYSEITFSAKDENSSGFYSYTSDEFYQDYSRAVQQGYYLSLSEPGGLDNLIVDVFTQDTDKNILPWMTIILVAVIIMLIIAAIVVIVLVKRHKRNS